MNSSKNTSDVPLLPGEEVVDDTISDIIYFCSYSQPVTGRLFITNYKIYFVKNIKSSQVVDKFDKIRLFFPQSRNFSLYYCLVILLKVNA